MTRMIRGLRREVMLVASAGGHLEQLLLLRSAWSHTDVVYVTTRIKSVDIPQDAKLYVVPDANRSTPLKVLRSLFSITAIILRERPRCVISTGALPGGIAVIIGKLLGARTIWIDSIANVEKLSLTARAVMPFCDELLTQWAHLCVNGKRKPVYRGRVL